MHLQPPDTPHADGPGPEPIGCWVRIFAAFVGCLIVSSLGLAMLAQPRPPEWGMALLLGLSLPFFLPAFARRARNLEERRSARGRARAARRICVLLGLPYVLLYLAHEAAELMWPDFSLADSSLGRLAQMAGVGLFLVLMSSVFAFHYYDAKAGPSLRLHRAASDAGDAPEDRRSPP